MGIPRMLTIQQAQERMAALGLPPKTQLTMIAWIEKYKLGRKLAGQWILEEPRFEAFLRGEEYREEGGDE